VLVRATAQEQGAKSIHLRGMSVRRYPLGMVAIESILGQDTTGEGMENWLKATPSGQLEPLPDDTDGVALPSETPTEMQESINSASLILSGAGRGWG
jgi:hypothetical protein